MRDLIPIEETKAKAKDFEINGKRIVLINLPAFYFDPQTKEGSTSDVLKVYNEMKAKGKIDGVILDLRYDGGGFLDEAVKLVGLFVKEPVVVQVKSKGEVRKLRASQAPGYIEEPLVVAINKFSASASEIVAGALKDYGRAIIVGDTQTYGKGTVQSVNPQFKSMELGSYKITSAQFYTPDGSSTQLKGVTSQIVIPSPSQVRDVGEKNQRFAIDWNQVESVFSKKNPTPKLKEMSEKRVISNKAFEPFKTQEETEKALKKIKEEEDSDNPYNLDPKKDVVLQEVLNITRDLVGFVKP
jgi:carboxyl-terminal processing protease